MKPESLTRDKTKPLRIIKIDFAKYKPTEEIEIGDNTIRLISAEQKMFFLDDLKERVQYLLKEIEKEIMDSEERRNEYYKDTANILDEEYEEGYQAGLHRAEEMIKKSFEGVLEK